jgi:hypothetical protein
MIFIKSTFGMPTNQRHSGDSHLGKKWTVEVIAEEWKCPIFTVSFYVSTRDLY